MIKALKNFLKKTSPKSVFINSSDASCRIINGSFQVSQCTVNEKLKINGAARLGKNTIVKKSITVNGQLEVTGAIFEGDIFSNGTSDVNHSTLRGKTYFSGNVIARDCQFSDSIILIAHYTEFINCQIDHIVIDAVAYVKAPQKIRLSNGCVICGDITFESKNGEVWIEKSSKIYGKVNGGKIIFI